MTSHSDADFADHIDALVKTVEPFAPHATYDRDGDCIEFFAKPDPFHAERIDDLVTVYYSRDTNEIVGAFIKGVERFCKKLLTKLPGFQIEIVDGRVKLACIFRARAWVGELPPGKLPVLTYKKLIEVADNTDVETELCVV